MKQFKVEVLDYKPHIVTVKLLEHNKELKVPRLGFDQRYKMGFFLVQNPEVLPRYF